MAAIETMVERMRRLQAEMIASGIDWLVCGPGADLQYLTGHRGHLSERLSVLLIPARGEPHYVVPGLEAALIQDLREVVTIHQWEETADPAALVGQVIGGKAPAVAVNADLWSVFTIRMQAAMPGSTWFDATPALRPLRMRKDQSEVALLRDAAHRTDEAWEEFITTPIAGLTEKQALTRLLELTHKRGLGPSFGVVASGPNSASPHHSSGGRVIQVGDAIVCDWGGTLEGYNSDVTRSAIVGEPSDAYRKAYAVILDANQQVLEATKPGVTCETLDKIARKVITENGYADHILHRVGHGLGLSLHEEPYLVLGNTLPLAEGMVFSDEPGLYISGQFGIRIEDAVVVTEVGGERLNEATRALTVLH